MKKTIFLVCYLIVISGLLSAEAANKFNLLLAPGTLCDNAVTLLWDKQAGNKSAVYEIALNGKVITSTNKTNYTLTGLAPNTTYTATIGWAHSENGEHNTVTFKTSSKGKVFNIIDYGAKPDATSISTKQIQAAINACSAGGTVYIPKGSFVSGALFLKSNMTLYLEKGAMLKGSMALEDYLPMIKNRFEGWELDTYASLLNAGTLKRDGSYNVKNLRITGEGTISGGGKALGSAMVKAKGDRSRGRLICLMNCQDVSISGLNITEPPSWTIHYIYSNNITCHDLHITTTGIRNGDGIDPDSSTDCYIFNCVFETGDDCIAIKSGKNPEGFYVAKPTTHVRVTNCDFISGHGISIGSEMSGGVSDVLVQDCKAGALIHGMQIKGTKERGGYVKNVTVSDCALVMITIYSALPYNNDGEAAPELPTFENFIFSNLDLSAASTKEPVIDINGFKDTAHLLKNVSFTNIKLPENAKIVINDAEQISFVDVKSIRGNKPEYIEANSKHIVH